MPVLGREKFPELGREKLPELGRADDDGRLIDVPADPMEERPLEPGAGGDEAESARRKLQEVLDGFA